MLLEVKESSQYLVILIGASCRSWSSAVLKRRTSQSVLIIYVDSEQPLLATQLYFLLHCHE